MFEFETLMQNAKNILFVVFIQQKGLAIGGPTVKQFYNKAQKGRDFLVPFAHDLACKV